MRALIPLFALGLAACEQAHVVNLADGSEFDCSRLEAEQSSADALRIIVDSTINTTDPAEVERLEQMQAEARQHLAEANARIEACGSAT